MQTHGMNKIRGNQILFHHDSVIKVNHDTLQESDYDDDLVVFLYGEKDKLDEMAKKAYGTNKLYARKNVLKQWFSILKNTNRYYKNFEDNIVDNIITKVDNVIKKKQRNPIYVSDKDSLKYEKGIGSDVAAVQQIDASTSAYNHENDIINNDEQCENSINNELLIQTHYVCCTPETIL